MDVSPYILKFKFFFKVFLQVGLLQSKSEVIYLPKKACLIIINRNTAYILDIFSCPKHQQQRCHNGNTKICMLIQYMYVDILFPLTKATPTMFERVTTHYQTLQTWISHNTTCYYNFKALKHALPHLLSHIFSKFSTNRP